VAVILCDTGIALLAYMDGITDSPTLSGVVLATLAAAGYAVFRVRVYIFFYISHMIMKQFLSLLRSCSVR